MTTTRIYNVGLERTVNIESRSVCTSCMRPFFSMYSHSTAMLKGARKVKQLKRLAAE